MKKWMKIVSILTIVGIVAAVAGYFFVYNKPHTNYEKMDADFSLAASDLFNEFKTNKAVAEPKYNGKVVEIMGTLTKVEEADSLVIAVFVFDQGMFGDEGIRSTMLPNHKEQLKNTELGSQIKLKGYLTGYNDTDVILEKCSITSKN